MKARRRPPPQGHLFGPPPPARRDETPVTIPMRVIGQGTDKAWLLAPQGSSSAKAAFVARSLVTQGLGVNAQQFTMPRWIAAERGWL